MPGQRGAQRRGRGRGRDIPQTHILVVGDGDRVAIRRDRGRGILKQLRTLQRTGERERRHAHRVIRAPDVPDGRHRRGRGDDEVRPVGGKGHPHRLGDRRAGRGGAAELSGVLRIGYVGQDDRAAGRGCCD